MTTNKMQLSYHPLADLFPMMNDSEFEALRSDMRDHGYDAECPVTLFEQKILDGRNRHEAALAEGLAPVYRNYTGNNPLEYVVRHNLKRRHLTREQRDEVIRKLREQGWTLQTIADSVGVGRGTVERATSDFPNGKSEIENTRGQTRPVRYAPRQAGGNGSSDPATDESSEVETLPGEDETKTDDRTGYRHVSDDSYEWYTPAEYIEAARVVMGGIDLDPASCPEAQKTVKAKRYYSKSDDGLAQEWAGRVWLNPPYNMPLIEQFTARAIDDYAAGRVESAIIITNNSTDTAWFHKLLTASSAVCLTKGRVKFYGPDGEGTGARQGQAVFYLGDRPADFAEVFSRFGAIVKTYDDQ